MCMYDMQRLLLAIFHYNYMYVYCYEIILFESNHYSYFWSEHHSIIRVNIIPL